jgi:hypothetical protein
MVIVIVTVTVILHINVIVSVLIMAFVIVIALDIVIVIGIHLTDMGIEERQAVPMSQSRPRESIDILSKASHKDILGIQTPMKLTSSGRKSGLEQRVVSRNPLTKRGIVMELGLYWAAPTTPVTTIASSETEMGTDLDKMPRAFQT